MTAWLQQDYEAMDARDADTMTNRKECVGNESSMTTEDLCAECSFEQEIRQGMITAIRELNRIRLLLDEYAA